MMWPRHRAGTPEPHQRPAVERAVKTQTCRSIAAALRRLEAQQLVIQRLSSKSTLVIKIKGCHQSQRLVAKLKTLSSNPTACHQTQRLVIKLNACHLDRSRGIPQSGRLRRSGEIPTVCPLPCRYEVFSRSSAFYALAGTTVFPVTKERARID